ncbi:neprilysin-1-like [Augochlora pura]
MTRIFWILTFVGVIAGSIASIRDYSSNLGWLFGADSQPDAKQSKERSLCETPDCVALAKMMTESMNPDVDPCENFYDYACGNWAEHNPLPKGEKAWSPLEKANAVVEKRLLDMLQANTKPDDFLGLKLSKKAYNACMDTDELERKGLDSLVATVWRIGGWPMVMEEDEWDEELYNWQYVDDFYAGLTGENSLHEMTVNSPWTWESRQFSLVIQDPDLPYRTYHLIHYSDLDFEEEDGEGRDGSQERGSEERDEKEDDHEEDHEMDDDAKDTQRKRIIESVKKRLRDNPRKYGNRKLSDEKHAGQKRTKRAAIRSKVHHKTLHERSRSENRRVLRNKETVNKASRHRKISERPNHSRKSKTDQNVKRYIYIDTNGIEDEEINGNRNRMDYYYDYGDEYSGGGVDDEYNEDGGSGSGSGGGGGGGVDDEDDENDDSGSGDWPNDDDSTDSMEKRREEERKEVRETREEFKEYVLNVTMAVAEAMNVQIPKKRIEKDINDLLKFQLAVVKLLYLTDEMQNSTLKELQEMYDDLNPPKKNSKIDWMTKVKNVGRMAGIEIDGDTDIVIPSYAFFIGIRELLDNTPSRTIVNYIHWNFISRMIKATTDQMAVFYYNWNRDESRPEKRSDECMENLLTKNCLGYEYVRRYFSDDWKKTAMDMVDDIQKEVEYRVKESTWMDDDTREFILTKLVFMDALIGYPPIYRNRTFMTNYFKGISFSHSHFENMMSLMRHVKRIQLRTVNLDTDNAYESYIDPLIVNAFYMPFENTLEITAADFQSPFYNPKQPWYTNFGIIGFIMAHEVNHGFDTMGRMFDRYGEYASWLSVAADRAYEKRADCFREQFTRYSVEENRTANIQIKDYGEQTSDENIADSMGLQAVFAAYQRRQRNCELPDPMLPGFENFTNNQMFFLSAANVWCTVYDLEKIKKRLGRDLHSLAPLRVIGSLSNSEDFAEAYHCPKGSPMNPEKKCNIWK